VVWRPAGAGGVEVVLVHRPKYDDWSLPKGKCDAGEDDERCALREVEEETGLRCSPGRELPSVTYVDHRCSPRVHPEAAAAPPPTSTVRRMYRKPLGIVLLAGLAFTAACSSGNDTDTSATTTAGSGSTGTTAGDGGGADIDYASLEGSITGSGSSFQDAFEQASIEAFLDEATGADVTYNSVGSGQGKQEFGQGLTDFAGTDSLVKADGSDGVEEGSFLYVPITAAPITVSYNLDGVDELNLSAATLANIFDTDITNWNDPAIAADNPDATLPDQPITVVHRSDGSGTTSRYTSFLETAAAADWTLGHGDSVAWAASTQAGEKNTGVAQLISSTPGAIGYVDLSDADAAGLVYANIQNAAGDFEAPTLEGASAALDGAEVPDDLSINTINAEGDGVYPITAPTFVLVRTSYDDPAVADLVKGYVRFLLTDAQDLAEENGYAPLPDGLDQQALAQLDGIG
jgi:phosphate transport system substrate-binding protein